MKNKGFTLVEILATIMIITLITLLIVPNILNSVNNKRKDISDVAKKMIYDAADIYVNENYESYPIAEGAVYCIKLETLVDSGKLSNPIKDMKTDKEIPLNYYVKTTINEHGQYAYNLVDNKSCSPTITYYVENSNNSDKEKKIYIKYPSTNYVKKYRILSGTTKENITLNSDQTASENVTITFTSNGTIKFWVMDGNTKLGETTVNITGIDTTAPTVSLSKITYENIPFDSSWTLTNSTIDSDGVLTLQTGDVDPVASSDFINVNGGFYYYTFDGYAETVAPNHGTKGGVYWEVAYYDENKTNTTALDGNPKDGHAVVVTLNEWKNEIYWQQLDNWRSRERYGENVKYIKINFKKSTSYGPPPVKVRNLKVYGEEMPNSFYLINVTAEDSESGIKSIKYAKGDKDSRYFENAGTKVENNQIRVTSNGVYSVCATDNAGNMTIEKITINQIN